MLQYKYVSVDIGHLSGSGNTDHRKIIDEHAKNGFRYIGYIPTDIDTNGIIETIDLIFESKSE